MPTQQRLDRVFLNVAKEIATLSNCVSHHVGCVIVNDGRIISQGYNGTPPGCTNCNIKFSGPPKAKAYHEWKEREAHHRFSEDFELHAEQNAILFSARHGICIDGSTLYCTLQPCKTCLKMICQSGIHRIVYSNLYDKSDYTLETYDMIDACNVSLEHFTE